MEIEQAPACILMMVTLSVNILLYLSGESKEKFTGWNNKIFQIALTALPQLIMCTEVKFISCQHLCQDYLAYFILAAAAQWWPRQKQETDEQRA